MTSDVIRSRVCLVKRSDSDKTLLLVLFNSYVIHPFVYHIVSLHIAIPWSFIFSHIYVSLPGMPDKVPEVAFEQQVDYTLGLVGYCIVLVVDKHAASKLTHH